MNQKHQIINATKIGGLGLRLIGTTDIDGNGTPHKVAAVDPIVLFDFAKYNSRNALPFRPHPHIGLTAMSFLPTTGTVMAWDSLNGDEETHLHPGGLYYVHAGLPAFHYEYPSPETVAAEIDMEFIQLVWNASDEKEVKTVIIQPEDVPQITTDNATIRVLAGEFCGVKSVQPFTHRKIIYTYIQLIKGKSLELQIPPSMKGVLFPIEGNLNVNESRVNEQQMMVLGEEDQTLSITDLESDHGSRFIIAAGEPIKKPFYKMIGLGGFIIGQSEDEVRAQMDELAVQAEHLKSEVPYYFPKE